MKRKEIVKIGLASFLSFINFNYSNAEESSARIRLVGPEVVRVGGEYALEVKASNEELSPAQTRAIGWHVTGPDYINWLSISEPALPSSDFFLNLTTNNFFYNPPTWSVRSGLIPGQGVADRPMSEVAEYKFRINPAFNQGSLPSRDKFELKNDSYTFMYDKNMAPMPLINETSEFYFNIRESRADVDGNGRVDRKDFDVFKRCMTGTDIRYDLNNLFSGCDCETFSSNGNNTLLIDFDNDGDVDMSDFGAFQKCLGLSDDECAEN